MGVPSFILQRLHRVSSASCQRVIDTGVPARSLAYGEEGAEILAGHEDGVARLWDAAHFTLARAFTPHDAPILSVASRGSRWATSCANGRVRVWGPWGEPIREFREEYGEEKPCWSVAWNRDGTRLLTTHDDETVRVYDPDRGKGRKRMRLPYPAHAVAYGPEDAQVALALDGSAFAWEGEREMSSAQFWIGAPRTELPGYVSFGFSRDRRMIAASVRSHDIHLMHWDETVTVLEGHTDVVTSLAWSPEGRFLLSGSEDCTARVWDTTTRDCVATLNDVAAIWSVAFHPHGHDCATMTEDGALRIYELGSTWYDLPDAIDQAAQVLDGKRTALWPTTAPRDLDFVLDVWSDLRRRARHQRIPPELAERGERVRQTVLELLGLLVGESASPEVPVDGLERFKHPLFRVALADLRLASELCIRLGGDQVALQNLSHLQRMPTTEMEMAPSGLSLPPRR